MGSVGCNFGKLTYAIKRNVYMAQCTAVAHEPGMRVHGKVHRANISRNKRATELVRVSQSRSSEDGIYSSDSLQR